MSIQEDIVSAFREATLATFAKQFNVHLVADEGYAKSKYQRIPVNHCAVMPIKVKDKAGAVAVYFASDVFLGIMNRALRRSYLTVGPEIEDGACEILNVVFGFARSKLGGEQLAEIPKQFPTMIRGNEFSLDYLTPEPSFIQPFDSDCGRFYLQIGFEGHAQ